ncbi:response regulator transcription factor [Microbispora cellulosiformans]|uniref:Response regulator transcription factor n=1 Tax=Microbispora cellulosiformans TaxID=2614688 RepID=A0A5J5KAJ1_9ACTN|nr:response regulator transcription factor [Microbispora cellulosiformans]KAA9381742.1 response regulator transcription factor [Microbispora cellulosiformans]
MTARVLVVDDQAVVRDGLVLLLGLLPEIEVVGSASDGETALRMVAGHRPDVVLMDLRMPRMNGVEATRRIRAEFPGTQVVVLTTYTDDESVFAALRAGARGFLTKSADAEEIARAVAAVMNGDAQLDPGVQRRLLSTVTGDAVPGAPTGDIAGGMAGGATGHATAPPPAPSRRRPREVSEPAPPGDPAPGPPPDGLTRREAEVLRLVARGLSNAEIAATLFVSEATVKTHINNLFAKAGLRDRAQAVAYAYRTGLARPGDD